MLIPEEKEMLATIVQNFYRGVGVIIDGGTYLGGSSLALAEGLDRINAGRRSACGLKPIQAFDLGTCAYNVSHAINHRYGTSLREGDCFIDVTRQNISSVGHYVDLHVGDITETAKAWKHPIEILFYDCGKSPTVDDFVVDTLMRRMIPGYSVLIQQDFYHEWLPWLHVSMGRLWQHFDYLGHVGTSAIFLYKKAMASAGVLDRSFSSLTFDEAERFGRVCRSATTDPGLLYMLDLAAAVHAGYAGDPLLGLARLGELNPPDDHDTRFGLPLPGDGNVRSYLESLLV